MRDFKCRAQRSDEPGSPPPHPAYHPPLFTLSKGQSFYQLIVFRLRTNFLLRYANALLAYVCKREAGWRRGPGRAAGESNGRLCCVAVVIHLFESLLLPDVTFKNGTLSLTRQARYSVHFRHDSVNSVSSCSEHFWGLSRTSDRRLAARE